MVKHSNEYLQGMVTCPTSSEYHELIAQASLVIDGDMRYILNKLLSAALKIEECDEHQRRTGQPNDAVRTAYFWEKLDKAYNEAKRARR